VPTVDADYIDFVVERKGDWKQLRANRKQNSDAAIGLIYISEEDRDGETSSSNLIAIYIHVLGLITFSFKPLCILRFFSV
jgi:hypothetical protein